MPTGSSSLLVQSSYDTTSLHIFQPRQWLPRRHKSYDYAWIGPKFPLLGHYYYLTLPLIIRLQVLCLTFSSSLLFYQTDLWNKSVSTRARHIKSTMQCETQTRLNSLTPPCCLPPMVSCLLELASRLLHTMPPSSPNFLVILI